MNVTIDWVVEDDYHSTTYYYDCVYDYEDIADYLVSYLLDERKKKALKDYQNRFPDLSKVRGFMTLVYDKEKAATEPLLKAFKEMAMFVAETYSFGDFITDDDEFIEFLKERYESDFREEIGEKRKPGEMW